MLLAEKWLSVRTLPPTDIRCKVSPEFIPCRVLPCAPAVTACRLRLLPPFSRKEAGRTDGRMFRKSDMETRAAVFFRCPRDGRYRGQSYGVAPR